jgi:hypothetical protein
MLELLQSLQFAPAQSHGGVAVLPIVGAANGSGAHYLTLGEALASAMLSVCEVSDAGSVPHLKVDNDSEFPVLLLDGEELLGAKQNRVVNTTLLLKKKSTTLIPVSCTEQGRWSYRTDTFEDSEVVMYHKARALKSRSVSASLKTQRGFASDQCEVWDSVEEMHAEVGTASPTGAMHDAFTARRSRLDEWEAAFPMVTDQVGLALVANGRVLGVEMVSRPAAYTRLHRRILRSYALDVTLEKATANNSDPLSVAAEFLTSLTGLEEHGHDSIGYGTDWRYEGGQVCGAALVHDDTCIHAVFFDVSDASHRGRRHRVLRSLNTPRRSGQ